MIRLGVIGMGRRAAHMTSLMKKLDSQVELAAIADPAPDSAQFRLSETGVDGSDAKHYPSASALLESADGLDALMIGSNCDSHSSLAVECASNGLPLFLEKPVAISCSQLEELAAAFANRESNVVVSFPLRPTPLFQRAMQIVR